MQFSVLSTWTAGGFSRHGSNSYGLSKPEFTEKVQRGDEACRRGDFQTAVDLYTEALQADPQSCVLYSNRSAALLKLGRHQQALDDAGQACELNPKWPKVSLLPLNCSKATMCSEMFRAFMNSLTLDSSWRLCWGCADVVMQMKLSYFCPTVYFQLSVVCIQLTLSLLCCFLVATVQ